MCMSAYTHTHMQKLILTKYVSVVRGQKQGILVRMAYLMSWVQRRIGAVNRVKSRDAE